MFPVETATHPDQSKESKQSYVYRVDVLPISPEFAERTALPSMGEFYSYPVYWLRTPALMDVEIRIIAEKLLIDPVLERYVISTSANAVVPTLDVKELEHQWLLEKRFLPGVTDNLGKTVEKSLSLLFPHQELPAIQVASGRAYLSSTLLHISSEDLLKAAEYRLYNPLVEQMIAVPLCDASEHFWRYDFPTVSISQSRSVETISLNLPDDELIALSRKRNLALTLDEMHVIQNYYKSPNIQQWRKSLGLPLWPTDVELEIIAQTWSEHCKHKIFAAKIEYTDASDPNYPKTMIIDSLFQTYIAGATRKLQEKRPDLLSVFKDNAGVLQWSSEFAVCFKAETHNSPSALEPYGGALTGIVGVNRDILGTGLGAKPLFNTDVFCFAHPDEPHAQRPTMLPAEAILQGVRKGVEDGGNKSGIPTINGALVFDPRYRAKPLVFCGTGGLLPLKTGDNIGYEKYTQPGDIIVMAGGRVGLDGIHGATFSSEVLNQDSPVSAVQIGDPITQKRLMDFLMEARDQGLITGVTDNGAGGLSSSVGEMAEITNGATIHLEQIPLKYIGLLPYEIVVSESQERMTLSVRNFEELAILADKHGVEIAAIGQFHSKGTFDIVQNGKLLASLNLEFLHHGLPQMNLQAAWHPHRAEPILAQAPENPDKILLKLLESPNICSREALIRQYDHEVQGRSVIKPLMGELQTAPSDAAVIQPILGQPEGLVVSNGICPQFSDWDAYHMAACALDEAVRNAVAVGADPATIALLDNFCWPDPLPSSRNPDASHKLAQLVRANQALYDLTLAYETPLISGKDSMKNDFDDGEFRLSIPPTLLISAMGKTPDINKAISMEFKRSQDQIFLVGQTSAHLGGSQYHRLMDWYSPYCPQVQSMLAKRIYQAIYTCICQGWIRSCHDLSEGGLAVALAESALGSSLGMDISIQSLQKHSLELRWDETLFSESPSRFIVSISPLYVEQVKNTFTALPFFFLGEVIEDPLFRIRYEDEHSQERLLEADTESLRRSWRRAPAQCYASGMQP